MDQVLDAAIAKFAVGQPVTRAEDPILVRGRGTYTDDVNLPNQAYAAFVRSPVAYGTLKGIDSAAALAMPGVLAVYTAADMTGYGSMKNQLPAVNRDGNPIHQPYRGALAGARVSFVGDPAACVVATDPTTALDAVEAVELDIAPLPAVTEPRAEPPAGAPPIYDDVPGNIGQDFQFGDSDAVAEAFAKAAHVTRLHLLNNRLVINPMEPRAVVADYDPATERFTIYSATQGVMGFRTNIANFIGVEPTQVRVISRNVGGSFGMKGGMFPEYICALHAARALQRPVKWTSSRSEAFLADHHGRDHDFDAELALDKDGHFLAVRLNGDGNLGAYLTGAGPNMSSRGAVNNTPGVYRTPLIEVVSKAHYTNTVAVSAYRGAGRPEGNYYMERLVDTAAAEMGIDPIELRRRNHIRADEMPYKNAAGNNYDSGDFPAVLERTVAAADWDGFAARKAESEARGKLRGRGIGQYLEMTAPLSPELGDVRFNPDGTITLRTGSHDQGQGHWSAFAQVLVDRLGVPFDAIQFLQTDSDELSTGTGTGGSKSALSSGNAIAEAADLVIEKGKQIAAHMLETDVGDIEFAAGRFSIAGTDRELTVMEIAQRLHGGETMPDGVPDSLDVSHTLERGVPTFPNGCHIAEVEIDPETGTIDVVRYATVNDFGTVLNPLLVEGQVQGGVVQGIGQCIMEHALYDGEGQLITGSYMDYAMPRAVHAPPMSFESLPSPATTNMMGIKGCGEAGCAGSLTSVMNAIVDALSVYGIRHINMPATPLSVWTAIQAAKKG